MKKILFAADPPEGGNGAAGKSKLPTAEQIAAENAELKAKIAAFEKQAEQLTKDEILIREKTALGLTREQAQTVIRHQRDFDALMAKQEADRQEAAAKAEKEAAKKEAKK